MYNRVIFVEMLNPFIVSEKPVMMLEDIFRCISLETHLTYAPHQLVKQV